MPDQQHPQHVTSDPPEPELEEVQQRAPQPTESVPVHVVGTIIARFAPNKIGPAHSIELDTTRAAVLSEDERRAVAILLCDADWLYSAGKLAELVRWPADVPLPISHGGAVWAKVSTGTGTLTVIPEFFAD
jgi:hypothetical protein